MKLMWWLYIKLFYNFFKIGLFAFGGGYAMVSLIQSELVNVHKWLTNGQFTDIIAISQMTSGPVGINSATYVGYTTFVNAGYGHGWAVLGSAVATFAVVLPSFILMILISKFFMKYKDHPIVEEVLKGLRPAVVGLMLAATLLLLTPENFSTPNNPWTFYISIFLFVFTFIASHTYKISPIMLICLCGFAGWILF